MNTVEALKSGENVNVMNDVTEVGGKDKARSLGTEGTELLVSRLESSLGLGGKVKDKDRLVNLNILDTSLLQLGKELNVEGKKLINLGDGVNGLTTVSLGEGQERNRTQDDRASDDTSLLSLKELSNRLGVGSKLEDLVVLEGGLDVVVVGVKPLHHLQRRDINGGLAIFGRLLKTTTQGEVFIDRVEVVLGVALGDNAEELDVVKDLVVVSKVIAGDNVDTSILLDLPVLLTKPLSLSQKLITRDLVTPVSFRGFLEVTELSHARETKNSAVAKKKLVLPMTTEQEQYLNIRLNHPDRYVCTGKRGKETVVGVRSDGKERENGLRR